MTNNEPTAVQPDYDELYPEHAKLMKISDKSQEIGQFLEWMESEKGYQISAFGDEDSGESPDRLYPLYLNTAGLLADYFGIDLKKIDQEKRAMLKSIREMNR